MGTLRGPQPDEKFLQLWNQIAQEPDPARRAPLMEQLVELLAAEQAEIKAQIKARETSPAAKPEQFLLDGRTDRVSFGSEKLEQAAS